MQVQQCKSHGKVLMPRDNNKQNQSIDKKIEKAGIGKRTPSMAIIKETTLSTMGHVQKASKQNLTQKNGTKKPISLKVLHILFYLDFNADMHSYVFCFLIHECWDYVLLQIMFSIFSHLGVFLAAGKDHQPRQGYGYQQTS